MNKIIATFKVQNKHVKNTNELKNWELPLTTNLLLQNTNNLCNTPSNRLRALTKIRKFLSQKQTTRLSEAYIIPTLKYCRLI